MTPEPFPFAALPELSRVEIDATTRVRHAARTLVRANDVAAAIGELCEAPVSITLRRVRPMNVPGLRGDSMAIVLAPSEDPAMTSAILVEMESALAIGLVSRALRQRTPRLTIPLPSPSAELAGSLGAILHAAFRRAHAGFAWRVIAVGPAQSLARDFAALHRRAVTASLTVELEKDGFEARVSLPFEDLPISRREPLTREALVRLGDAPIALPMVVATCLMNRSEVALLRAGDALLLPSFQLRNVGGHFTGPVALLAPLGDHGFGADLAEGGGLVLRPERVERRPWEARTSEEPYMPDEPNRTLEVLDEAPVVVRVELGAVEMKASEWAILRPGDVVTLGRKIGDPATLRIGGVVVARGELVQVDGEYGVRILGRAGEK